jgi:hypothetical protein
MSYVTDNSLAVFRFLIALLLPLTGLAAPAPKGKDVLYHPTKVGDKRVYVMTTGKEVTDITDEVTRVDVKGGRLHVSVSQKQDDGTLGVTVTEVSAAGVVRLTGVKRALSPPMPLLRLPAKAGNSWTWDPDTPDGGKPLVTTYTVVKEQEEVEVPAGKFKAIRVDAEWTLDGTEVKTTQWYAPDVGLVKRVYRAGVTTQTQLLKSFTPGK